MKITTFYTVLLAFTFLFSGNVYSQSSQVLKLKSGNFELVPNINTITFQDLESVKYGVNYFVYVHFSEMPTNAQKQELWAQGVELLDFVPDNSFMAKINETVNLTSLANFNIDGVYLVLPEFKMSSNLAFQNYPEHALNGNRVQIIVQNHKQASAAEMDKYYTMLGAGIMDHYSYSNLTTIDIPTNKIQNLASHPLVKFLEPIAPEAVHEDIVGQSNHRSNYISNTTINNTPYNGNGVWIAIGDDGELGPHIDYTGRMDQTSVGPSSGSHGDHVSGIMMGAGNKDPKARGMAWGADIKVYDVWDAVNSTPTSYYNPGVVVTSTSYGNGCNAGYTSFAQTADQQVRLMPNLMHVFSAGNSGTSNCNYGAGAGWGNITGGIKAGKNVLAVGNVTYTDALASSSSRGPASDGRIKPDICANGTQVFSCQPNNTYANFTGTSMAAPGVSGTYGQLVHAYRELNSGATPPSALVKGALLNTADDLGNIGPDFKFGWGRMNARKVVEVFQNNTFMVDSITQNAAKTHNIAIPAGVKQVKIMVYWNDYEGSTVTTTALVNNIDMTVTNPSSTVLLPYILDPTPNAINLNMPATNGVDTLNNMEQVVIDNPASGTYTVNVSGTSIPQGPQTYYVIYEFIMEDIIVTYPVGGEGFTPGTVETIRWDAPNGISTITVEYSIDNGTTWAIVATNLVASRRYYNWTVPNVLSGSALVRVTRGSISGQSQMNYSIIGVPTNINVSSSCPTEFVLSWDSVPGATAYEVSILGTKYMDSVTTVNTLSALLTGYSSSNSYWVSVKAKTATAIGTRAIAVEKQPGIWNCSLPYDIEITGLLPSGNALFDCVNYNNVNVTVRLINTGQNAITNVPLAYQFNGGSTVTGQYMGTLNPGDTVDYSFAQTVSFGSPGMYQIDVWKTSVDDNPNNDSIFNPFEVYSSTTVTLPYSEDFESFSSCPTTSDCGATNCSLANGWRNIINGSWDDIDFRTNNGATPSSGTGPSVDHNPGTNVGNYLYLEASGGCEFQEGQVISPCIDITSASSPVAKVWFHMLGADLGELHFDVFSGGKWYNDVAPARVGNHGGLWVEQAIDLSAFVGNKVNVRFRGITGAGWSSDIAIDDFSIVDGNVVAQIIADSMPCYSAGPVTITNTQAGAGATYAWDFGTGATPATANTSGPHTVIYANTGARTVRLIVTEGAVSDTAYKTINVVNLPVASFTSVYNAGTDEVEFTNTSTFIGSVLWDFGDGSNNSTIINPVHQYPSKGNYDAVLIVFNSCGSNTLEQNVENYPLGISTISNTGSEMVVYPNPSTGMITIQLSDLQGSLGDVVVFDVQGKLVYAESIEVSTQNMELKLDLAYLNKGVYMIGFTSDSFIQKVRLIIQ